ncbi:hypothetical protein W911_04255 [Hyphomicrobium nitrativorans NL23]|uniref:L,D-TPase catalytic domain-containing protein n=1 Tax=Hyphomicrobium nitrativorans NL23 TaxID=1029756 RepID=V5SBB8_9HYPH|nr:L,D-transpeptidase family protein [Hyphomicrobium nitrativorans]AHB47798.1 hypothetical protein W911_04255 [Hyphomicrobium nitrativorans NL23]
MREFISGIVVKASVAALVLLTAFGGSHTASAQATDSDNAEVQGLSGPAVMAIVSLVDQRIAVYDAHGGVVRARVSSGRTEYETPVGIYSVLQKNRDHVSNLYEDARMPFMQRMTWSGVALHAGALPGHPASAGCVRMPHQFASEIFEQTKLGTRIIVARRDVAPVPFSHSALPKPQLAAAEAVLTRTTFDPLADEQGKGSVFEPDLTNWPERQAVLESLRAVADEKAATAKAASAPVEELKAAVKARADAVKKAAGAKRTAERAKGRAEGRVKQAERRLAAAKQPATIKSREDALAKAQAGFDEAAAKLAEADTAVEAAEKAHAAAEQELGAAQAVYAEADAAAKEARRKTLPISVFVSLKEQRVYIRQGHEAVTDAPVTISEPETPIGTHVYTAVDFTPDGDDVRWTAVSIGPHVPGQEGYGKKKEPTPADAEHAGRALDRIAMPAEVSERVSASLWPGSSIIVSDEEQSKETGESTDFVVLISGEPQGGIVIRPRRERQPQLPEYFVDYDAYYYYDEYGRRYDRRRYDRRNDRRYGRYDRYYDERRGPPRDRSFFGLW